MIRDMSTEEDNDPVRYQVLVNHEEQYSIWEEGRDIPLGWKAVGKSGSKEECLKHVEEVWTDMRPLSLRKALAEAEEKRGTARDEKTDEEKPSGE